MSFPELSGIPFRCQLHSHREELRFHLSSWTGGLLRGLSPFGDGKGPHAATAFSFRRNPIYSLCSAPLVASAATNSGMSQEETTGVGNTHTNTRVHTCEHTQTQPHRHTCEYARASTHVSARKHMHTRTCECMHAHVGAHKHVPMCTCEHTRTCEHTDTHMHTHVSA